MRRAFIASALSIGLAASVVVASPASADGPINKVQFGMHVPNISIGVDPGVSYGAIRLWDSGVAWGQVQQGKNKFWWNGLDASIANANEQGAEVLYVLGSTPKWAATNKKQGTYPNKGAASVPKMADWKKWVKAVVQRHGNSINAYQIWNEANLSNFWAGTPKQMANLTKAASKIIRKYDPGAKVVSASSTVRLESAYKRFFPAYLKELKKANWPVDVISVHTYPDGQGNPGDRAGYLDQVNTQLKKSKVPASKQLWDTEVNFGIKGPGKIKGQSIGGDTAAAWTAQTYLENMIQGVDRAYWYFWDKPNSLLGITMQDGTPGAVGYQTAYMWMNNSYFSCVEGNVNVCQMGDSIQPDVVAWSTSGSGTYTVPVNATVKCDAMNRCSTVKPGDSIAIGNMPLWFGSAQQNDQNQATLVPAPAPVPSPVVTP
jgi:hypothetical protein